MFLSYSWWLIYFWRKTVSKSGTWPNLSCWLRRFYWMLLLCCPSSDHVKHWMRQPALSQWTIGKYWWGDLRLEKQQAIIYVNSLKFVDNCVIQYHRYYDNQICIISSEIDRWHIKESFDLDRADMHGQRKVYMGWTHWLHPSCARNSYL